MTGDAPLGDRLPWLEPVEEEQQAPARSSAGRMIGFVILGLVLLGLAVGSYGWWSSQGATEGNGELIAAPPGPYKVKPADPGGLSVEGEGDTAFAASEGAEPQGRIDVAAIAEAPVTEGMEAKAAPGAQGLIQLGAFSSEAAANSAWKALAQRFAYLEPLAHQIVPVKSEDKTLYRLRASGPDAAALCARLRVAGETCLSVD